MRRLKVSHITTYDYANPVTFGEHRMMFRPRDSHDLRILSTNLIIEPQPTAIRWMHDVHGNSVAVASFDFASTQLRFESEIVLQHFETSEPDCPIEPYARTYPFRYAIDEAPDLARAMEHQYPDAFHAVDEWAKSFAKADTWEMLTDMTYAIKRDISYLGREAEGIQAPADTLAIGTGSCRDLAVLMMEGVRALGLAARFVSGYLYSPDIDGTGNVGGGATHAWTQVYLPGAGWVEFDPTNGIIGNRDLIRVAVARDPEHAVPLRGTWTGAPGDYLGMQVQVAVTSADDED
ncbi:MAG TPA: transglutaminase family protein [Alphaproteobacteria bacterium]|jgi:transglutaminase-like putative cysteine protease|nr:transglutaminase family protein [Alphaproteobacteria bacterium]